MIKTNERIHIISFTDSFVDNLADFIHKNYLKKGRDLSRLAIVFGGKRPALFLKRELARRSKQSFYSPQFFTIDDFVRHLVLKETAFQSVLDLDHCYVIYNLAREVTPEILKGRESFAQFLPWTREILAFIDQLDLENVPSSSLRNIEANAQIGYSVPEDINRLLGHVSVLREAYHKYLTKHKTFSRGFQYQQAANSIDRLKLPEFDEIIFGNFFYLHRTEMKIMTELFERGKAHLFFQGDERRWPALERLSRAFNTPIVEGEKVDEPQFDLKLYGAFDAHAQAGLVREILSKINNPEKTVVVLSDPQALIPLLSEISSLASEFNVSMGYPLQRSSFSSLLNSVFQAQLSRKEHSYYARDYLKILRHPLVKNLRLSDEPAVMRVLIHKIEEILTGQLLADISGHLFLELKDVENCVELYEATLATTKNMGFAVSKEELKRAIVLLHEVLFNAWEDVRNFKGFADAAGGFLTLMEEKSSMGLYPLNRKIAERIMDLLDEFRQAAFVDEEFPPEEIFKIFQSRIEQEMISFHGSPLKGLQILGLFETRSLNFENVIVLDVNEGVLPHLKIYEPLIPREVMIKLNLDRLELEEEIQRYQFMRLISSAKNVHLIYQERADKEKSRFVEELIWQEEKKKGTLNPITVTRPAFTVKVSSAVKKAFKTPEMVAHLRNMRYSASSVNMYLRNPYEFYRNYVLGLREREDLLDEPENREVGIFVHGLLEDVFKVFVDKTIVIDPAFRQRLMRAFEDRFTSVFGRSMSADGFLLKAVLESRLERLLDHEEDAHADGRTKLLYIEKRFEDVIRLSMGDVRFVYQVDRVDELGDGTVMIVDYKTGSIDPMPKAIERIAHLELSRENIRDNVKSFQIPLYFHYLNKQFPDKPINAAFFNLRTVKMDRFITSKVQQDRAEINAVFLRALDFIISEIIDPQVPFVDDPPPGRM